MADNYMQWIQLGLTLLLGAVIPLGRNALDNLRNMLDVRMAQILERVEQQDKRINSLDQGLQDIRLQLAKDYVEQKEFDRFREDMMKEFRAIEQQLKVLSGDLNAQWKEFFASREKSKETK